MNRPFTKEDIQITNKQVKRCSILGIKEMQIETTKRYHRYPLEWQKIKTKTTKTIPHANDDAEQLKLLDIPHRITKQYSHSEKSFGSFL